MAKRPMTDSEDRIYRILMKEFREKLPSNRAPWCKVSGTDLSMVCLHAVAAVSLYHIPASEMYQRAQEELRRDWGRPHANYYVGPRVFARVYKRAEELLKESK